MNVLDAFVRFLADTSAIDKATAPGGAIDKSAQAAGQRTGGTLSKVIGNGVTKAFTVAGAAGGALFTSAIESGVKFEDQLRTINTVAGLSDDQLAKVGDSIQELSRQTGKSTDELTQGFYDLVSAGVPADKAISVLSDSAKLATGALGSTADTVDLVTSVLNAYGLSADKSAQVTDVFAKAVADGKVTAAQLGESIARIAPIAAQAGVSMQEVSAGYAVLTAKGVPAAEAATQMTAAISALLTPNEELNKLTEQTGINFAELARQKGLAVALNAIRDATHGNNEQFAKALGSIDAYKFALATTGDNAKAFSDEIVAVTNSQGLAQDQFNEKSKSAYEQGQRLKAQVDTFIQDLGGPFVDAFGPAITAVGGLGNAMLGLGSISKVAGGLLGGIGGRILAPLAKGGAGIIGGLLGKLEIGTRAETLGLKIQTGIIKGLTKGDAITWALQDKLAPVTDKIGGFLGSKFGKAFSVGFAAVAVVEVIQTYDQIKDQLAQQTEQLNQETAGAIANQTDVELQHTKEVIEKGLKDINGVWDAGLFTTDARKGLENNLAAVNAEMERRSKDIAHSVSDNLAKGKEQVRTGATEMMSEVPGAVAAAGPEAAKAAGVIPASIADGVLAHQNLVGNAMSSLLNLMKNGLSVSGNVALTIGQLLSKDLAAGMRDGRKSVNVEAERVRAVAEDHLAKLIEQGGTVGKKAAAELARGLKSKDPQVRAEAQRIQAIVNGSFAQPAKTAFPKGQSAGKKFTDGVRSGVNSAAPIVLDVHVRGASNTRGKALGGPVEANQPYIVGERGYELFVPKVSGEILTHAEAVKAMTTSQPALAGGGGDVHYHIPVEVTGVLAAKRPDDIARPLRQLAATGALSTPREADRVQLPRRPRRG